MTLLERINASGTTIVMATHEAGIVDQMKRRVVELSAGQIVRDERQGGYTTAIPTISSTGPQAPVLVPAAAGVAASEAAHTTGAVPAVPLPAGPKVPIAVMQNAQPLYVEPEVTDDV